MLDDCFRLQTQFDLLSDLLADGDVGVRVLAVQGQFFVCVCMCLRVRVVVTLRAGVCRVLNVYWELIPFNIVKQLLTRIVSELAFDARFALSF